MSYPISKILNLAHRARCLTVQMLAKAGSGHLGGSLSSADILATLYGHALRVLPDNPQWGGRDRFICSIGHIAPIYYATLALAGFFPQESLDTLRQLDSPLQGHPSVRHGLQGVDCATGSLGQGLSVALGMALGAKLSAERWNAYVLLGDGELQEGQVWEAAMAAAHHEVHNLTAFVDWNGVQIDGPTVRVMDLGSLEEKWRAFGWLPIVVNGHDPNEICAALDARRDHYGPAVILCRTHMGYGITSIEDDWSWHGKSPLPDQVEGFLSELNLSHERRMRNLTEV